MNIFCDTSVLVASSLKTHPHHKAAVAILASVRDRSNRGYISSHALAETFSVLSRMPTTPKLTAEDVLQILENNILPHFTLVAVGAEEYPQMIRDFVQGGFSGGAIYDFVHLRAASKINLDLIQTFNAAEWRHLSPELAPLIKEPS